MVAEDDRLYGAEEMAWDHSRIEEVKETALRNRIAGDLDYLSERILEERSNYWNGTIYLNEVIHSLHARHPLYLLYNKSQLRYDFGTTYFNWCELRKKPLRSLPSLLRILQMKIAPQACLRIIVLVGFQIKMVMCMAKAKAAMVLYVESRLLWRLHWLSPLLELLASTTLMLIVCLHKDQDKAMWNIMHYDLQVFAVLFLAQGFFYSLMGVFKPLTKIDLAIFCFRLSILLLFAISAPSVSSTYVSYLHYKTCHTHVSISAALQEYACVFVILVFPLTQLFDFNTLSMSLLALRPDTMPRLDLPQYHPAFVTPEFDSAEFAHIRLQPCAVPTID